MPHLAFFAAPSDVVPIFEFVLAQAKCQVLESYSAPDHGLRSFSSVEEIGRLADQQAHGLGLMLYAPSMGGRYVIERFDLEPGAVTGKSWRERVHGWGLIQLEFSFGADRTGCLEEARNPDGSNLRR